LEYKNQTVQYQSSSLGAQFSVRPPEQGVLELVEEEVVRRWLGLMTRVASVSEM
jgi:hypothetical protein